MPALLPSHSLMELCPSGIFSGPWTKATIAKFLFNGHGKNSGLISPNSFFYLGTLVYLKHRNHGLVPLVYGSTQ